jgi:hypothetical protein
MPPVAKPRPTQRDEKLTAKNIRRSFRVSPTVSLAVDSRARRANLLLPDSARKRQRRIACNARIYDAAAAATDQRNIKETLEPAAPTSLQIRALARCALPLQWRLRLLLLAEKLWSDRRHLKLVRMRVPSSKDGCNRHNQPSAEKG